VNHAAGEAPRDWTPVIGERELQDEKPHHATLDDTKRLLVRRGGRIYCISEVCSHLGGPLA
jgi:nitrite reductase/ring-hydroxylating ferredoxin subunit